MVLKIEKLSKSFEGLRLFENLNVTMHGGSVIGLIGKNGVGKSTFLNCLASILEADVEDVYLNNQKIDLGKVEWKSSIGYLSDIIPVIEDFTAFEYFQFIATIYQVPNAEIVKRAQELFSYFFDDSLLFENLRPLKSFSTGMIKKVQIISAVIHKPAILLLDEPFSGLDSTSNAKLISFIKYYSKPENIIIFTSHDLNHHRVLANNFLILDSGHFVFNGDLKALEDYFIDHKLMIDLAGNTPNFSWI